MKRLFRLLLWIVCFTLFATSYSAHGSSEYPKHYITFIVPFGAGGGFDTQARLLAPYLKKYMPNNVDFIVRNITGASGQVGAVELIKSKPDGYTIGIMEVVPLAIVQLTGQLTGTDVTRDFTWLGRTESPGILAIMAKNGRFKSVKEMKGNKIRSGTTSGIVGTILVIKALGGEPYVSLDSGTGESITGLLRGDYDIVLLSYTTALKQIQLSEGKLIPVLICRLDKRPELPNVPNLMDVGLESLVGILAADRLLATPAGLPEDVMKMLTLTIAKATKDPEFISRMLKAGYMPEAATSEESKKIVEDVMTSLRVTQNAWKTGP